MATWEPQPLPITWSSSFKFNHTVNQLKTNHPQPFNPSPRPTINQLITIQSHDNHTTTPERNPTQSANHPLTEITNHNQSPDSQSNQFKMITPNHQQSPHDLKLKSNRGDQWPHENHTNIDNPRSPIRISQQPQSNEQPSRTWLRVTTKTNELAKNEH